VVKVTYDGHIDPPLPKVGIVGCGNVGYNTLKAFHLKGLEVMGYDIHPVTSERLAHEFGEEHVASTLDGIISCDVIFECVPTESLDDSGRIDMSIVTDVVDYLSALEDHVGYSCQLFVQRSTCLPGTAREMSKRFKRTNYAVNPSFLRKATQWKDTIDPELIAYAGDEAATTLLERVYSGFLKPARYVSSNFEAMELYKYVENSTEAVLISLWNEILLIADELGIPRNQFIGMMEAFPDRGKFGTVLRVPGQAFGLWCLPKDLAAFINWSEARGLKHDVISGALATNERIRREKGTNPVSGAFLLKVEDGRIKMTDSAKEQLLS
jgi:nucleotide sugar dehydrogenase